MQRAGLIIAAVVALSFSGVSALAQEGPGGAINPGRDCQTILKCNYKKGGSFRGCISSYSCRVCKFVPANCQVGGQKRTCQRIRCTWG
ncbi:hypothetical protein SAMN04488061_2186 [Filomicrobium insigne]|uniref:Uncharacterized protein n=2 Tax=Filomicrobium TaxID=119044 RepID=A0A0D6JG95_9HYPH|nr:conserved exported protein of unknown function [Candidatus Filomicrobium marinum]SDP10027.1 hypothetical protein SAMN04488061_2186 [Filomicrobium insigne]